MEGGMRANGQCRSLRIAHLPRFRCHGSVFGQTLVLGVAAKRMLQGRGKDLVDDLEALNVAADRVDIDGELHAIDWLSRFAPPKRESRRKPEQGRNAEAAHA